MNATPTIDEQTTTLLVTIATSELNDLRRLADAKSSPGAAVSPDDVAGSAIRRYLDDERRSLKKLAAEDETAELDRVFATHGGEES